MNKKENGSFTDGQHASSIRHMVLDAILKYDEEMLNELSTEEFIELVKESDEQLVKRLIYTLNFYYEESCH